VIYTDYKGIAELVYKDSSSLLLQDTLYIPGLGVNLVLVRKIYQASLKGLFNKNTIHFTQGNKKVISAKID
jgi:hypothetical protein